MGLPEGENKKHLCDISGHTQKNECQILQDAWINLPLSSLIKLHNMN